MSRTEPSRAERVKARARKPELVFSGQTPTTEPISVGLVAAAAVAVTVQGKFSEASSFSAFYADDAL